MAIFVIYLDRVINVVDRVINVWNELPYIYCKFYIFKCFRNSIEKIDFSNFLVCNILLV